MADAAQSDPKIRLGIAVKPGRCHLACGRASCLQREVDRNSMRRSPDRAWRA